MSQKRREYILDLLTNLGMPDPGTIHIVRKGDEANYQNEPLDDLFHPESATVLLIPKDGHYMDGQCYDRDGYKVYVD